MNVVDRIGSKRHKLGSGSSAARIAQEGRPSPSSPEGGAVVKEGSSAYVCVCARVAGVEGL